MSDATDNRFYREKQEQPSSNVSIEMVDRLTELARIAYYHPFNVEANKAYIEARSAVLAAMRPDEPAAALRIERDQLALRVKTLECERDAWRGSSNAYKAEAERAAQSPLADQDGPGEEDGPWADGWEQRASQPPVELPCDKCGRGVDEHVGAGMPCPTGDYRDSLYGLLVRHGWSQHEAHATAYDGGMPVRAGSIPALWVLDGYIAAWYTYDPIAAGKKVGTGKLIPLYSRPPEPPAVSHTTEDVCDRLSRLASDVMHIYGVDISSEIDDLVAFYRRGGDAPTKPAAPWCSLCQGEHEPCNPDEWHRKTRELNQLAAETRACLGCAKDWPFDSEVGAHQDPNSSATIKCSAQSEDVTQ